MTIAPIEAASADETRSGSAAGESGISSKPLAEGSMTESLDELADRVEAASGPNRELDALIFIATSWPTWQLQTDCEPFPDEVRLGRIQEPGGIGWREAPCFTDSLDAAMSLVPEGWLWRLWRSTENWCGADVFPHGEALFTTRSHASTPALALTAAALRARGTEQ